MKTHSTKKTLSMIMALLMIITCLVSPAMASPAESTPAAVESQTATTVDADGAVSMDVSADVTAQKKVTIIVELEGETPYRQSGDLQLAAVGYDSQMAAMAKAESSIEATLNRSIEVDSRFTLLFNGFSFEGESWMIDAINKMDGFTAFEEPMFRLVEPAATGETNLTPSMSLSTGLSGATTAWDLGYTGEGMTVAIIDTGIHATHEAFSVEPENGKIDKAYLTEVFAKYGDKMHCGTDVDAVYNTAKMPFNWDYFDGDAIPNHTASEHGTHVAGIAAGNNGADFKGIAPDAQIITMQVFTNEGGGPFSSIMEALEDCVYLGVDAVNMSLGVTTWFTAYESVASTMESIYEALEDAGITVAAAAGNESVVNQSTVLGDSLSAYYNAAFSWNPDFGTINAPASFPGSLSVASMVNCNAKGGSITVEGVPFYPTPVGTNPALGELASGEYEIVYVGLCSPEEIDAAGGVEGKIALTQRGTLNFTQKCTNAAEAGAAGVILFNNKTGAFTPSVTSTIPFGYLSMEDGNALVELLPDGVHGKLILDTGIAYKGLNMSSTSSWGTTPDLKIKPEIAAPGDEITSAVAWLYSSPSYPAGDHAYDSWSGTSMASPHIAAGMLLIKQRLREVFPEKSAAEINDLAHDFLLSTAHQMNALVRQAGAGAMDLKGALTTEAYLTVPGADRPKLEVGESKNGEFQMTFEVTNFGSSSKTYDIVPSVLTEQTLDLTYTGFREQTTEGAREYNQYWRRLITNPTPTDVKLVKGIIKDVTDLCEVTGPKAVTVKAGETVKITLNVKAGKELMAYYAENFPAGYYLEGYIALNNRDEKDVDLSIPFLGFIGDWDYAPMFDQGFWWQMPYNVNNMAQMEFTMGTYVGYGAARQGLGLNWYWDETDQNYNPDRNAISPNGDGWLETVNQAEFSLMRNAKTMKIYLQDAEGNVLKTFVDAEYTYRKEYFKGGFGGGTTYTYVSWDFDANELAENETVYLVLEAWLDHEGYDPADNMNGRMVFPVTKDTVAPAVTLTEDGIQILDDNYIAYYGIYSDSQCKDLLFETGVFAEERGVAETYATDLETCFVRVADYARNEAFYMVRDGQVYLLDADAFGHSDKTIIARQNSNLNTGYYEYNWITYNVETPELVTFLAEPSNEIPDNVVSVNADYQSGAVAADGTAYVNTLYKLYTLDLDTLETTLVGDFWTEGDDEKGTGVRSMFAHPTTGEVYAFNRSKYTGTSYYYFSKVNLETAELTPVLRVENSWTISYNSGWSCAFIDDERICLYSMMGPMSIINIATGERERTITLNFGDPYHASLSVNGNGGSMLYDEDENCIYMTGGWWQMGAGRYYVGAVLVYDFDTDRCEFRYLHHGAGLGVYNLFYLNDVEEDECITYSEVIAPTCFSEGYTLHTCVDCGKEYRDNFVPALEHEYEAVVTEPTCTEMGYTTYTCAICGDSYVADYTLPVDHEFVEVVIEPTCTEAGYTIYMCECGYEVIGDVVDPIAHSYTVNVIAPTCDTFGFTEHICTVCGDYYVSDYTAPYCPSAQFTDVALDAWYHEAVDYVLVAGLMNGMSETEFAPENNMTRAQLVTVLYRLAGSPSVEGLEHPFADVAAETWYTDAVIWAYNAEVVNGVSDTAFAPNANITREQLVAVLYRFYGEPEANTLVLADYADANTISDYAVNAMAWAVENGIVNGLTETTLAPRGTATRAQIATILMRLA